MYSFVIDVSAFSLAAYPHSPSPKSLMRLAESGAGGYLLYAERRLNDEAARVTQVSRRPTNPFCVVLLDLIRWLVRFQTDYVTVV